MGHSETHERMHGYVVDRDWAAIESQLAPGFMYEDIAQALTVKTPGEFTDYLKSWVTAFSDAGPGSASYSEGSDFSIARFHGRGTFDGSWGEIQGNGGTMDVPFCEVIHYASDGRPLTGELYYDQMSIMRQLGLMPADS